MVSEYLSKKLRWLSILMTVCVVIIHAFNYDFLLDRGSPLINHLFFSPSVDVGRSAVPLFFLISGLLFFKGCKHFSFTTYKEKVGKRIKTVLIPYLTVSALFIFLVWFSYSDVFPYYLRLNYLLPEYSPKWILTAWLAKPQAYYLWFLRNLFVLALLSPAIFWVVKRLGWFFIVPSLLAWIFVSHLLPSALLSAVFFALGAFISVREVRLPQKVSLPWLVGTIVVWLGVIVLSKFVDIFPWQVIVIFYNIYTFLGVVIAWITYDYISPKFVNKVSNSLMAKYIFCIYLFHHIFLSLFSQMWIHFAGNNSLEVILPMYYISIPLSIILSMLVAFVLDKLAPPFYRLITGSR